MWICQKCGEQLEEAFELCWKCGTSRSGAADPAFEPEPVAPPRAAPHAALACLRCGRPLDHMGTKKFHEGARWGVLGELGELFVKKESFEVYACSRCGHVEFFVSHIVGEGSDEE